MSALSAAAQRVQERVQALADRPAQALTLAQLIDRRMAGYAGRDVALVQRMATWQQLLGDFALEAINDLPGDSRSIHNLETAPGLMES